MPLRSARARLALLFGATALAASALTSAHPAAAEEPSAKELKQADEELARIKRDKPGEYRQVIAVAQAAFGAFGFGVGPFDGRLDERTRAAVRKYQRMRGLPQSGELDARTLRRLTDDFEIFRKDPVALPALHVSVDLWDEGWISASGTWVIVGEASAVAEQTSDITCHRARALCFESTAILSDNKALTVLQSIHEIERWDSHEISTKPSQSAECARYTLRVSRPAKRVTGVRLRTSSAGLCKGMAPELHLRLVDGWDVTERLIEQRSQSLKGLILAPGLSETAHPR